MIWRRRWLGALGAALLLWAAFFPGLGALAWISLIPLFWALDGAGLRRGVGLGALFGVAFFLGEFSSLFSLWPFVGPMTVLIWVALSLYGALFLTLVGAAGGTWGNPLLWAGGWALIEAARGAGPLGFTFGSVPGTMVGSPFLPAVALGGPWLLSLGVAWTAGCLARGVRERRWLPWAAAGPLVLCACALVPTGTGEEGTVTAVLVQPNIAKAEQLDARRLPERAETYRGLLEGIAPPADLILLPENALPWLRDEPEHLRPFAEAARRVGATLVVGTADFQEGRIYNAILVVSSRGEIVGTYAKTRLVPFGEYVPWRNFWTGIGLGRLIDPFLPFDQTPGEEVRPVEALGIMVCFESTFPRISRELVRRGAEVLLVPTNDAWFGQTRILWEHYALGSLRAAEAGRALVQIAQTGISGGWGPRGEDLGRLPAWTKGSMTLALPLRSGSTPYVRIGDGPVLGLAAALVLLGARTKRPRRGRGRGGRVPG
ncbi:apolipoprotein N-acyltransferase [Candidatus Bipolaricaulota bacterium]|nr:apolipoprotein N-acyltransferase [Candidatus Bipolaricaulota bacterium]